MVRYLFPGLVAAAILELASIIWVGERLGVVSTLALMVIAGVSGLSVIRTAGLGLFATLRNPPRDLHFASRDAAERFLMLIAGVLLIVPGFASDLLALILLAPPVRRLLAARFAGKVRVHTARWQEEPSRSSPLVIEGEAHEVRDPGDPR